MILRERRQRGLALGRTILLFIALGGSGIAYAQELVGQKLKLTGQWSGDHLKATRVQQWETKEDPERGRVAGQIDTVDTATRVLRIGPILVEWSETTRLEGISPTDLALGRLLEASGRLAGPARLIAKSIKAVALAPDQVQIRGTVTEEEPLADGSRQLTVLGVRVKIPKGAYGETRSKELTRRPDERRPEDQLTLQLLRRPLTIGGELKTESRYHADLELRDDAKDDVFRLDQELQLEFFYSPAENISLFLEGKALYEDELYTENDDGKFERAIERGETWLYVGNLFRSGFSLQVGRQNIRDRRSWWWDRDLDAVRLHYDRRGLHAELAIAQEMGAVSAEEDRNDPKAGNVLRLLGSVAWLWAKDHRLDGFFLYQNDHSSRQTVGQLVKRGREDSSDAALLWLGVRTSGTVDLDRSGELKYRLEGAQVDGHEILFNFRRDREKRTHRRVSSHTERDISGWGLDSSVSWETKLAGEPTLSLGYALGSGDRSPERGTDRAFRQTGLNNNKGRFNGVNRFRYYGELLRPELSNLHIWTASAGFRFWQSSSVEFVYHFYQQVHATSSLRDDDLDANPLGKHRTIGQEWDVVLGLEEWQHIEVGLIGSLFRAGSAYGPLSGEIAYGLILKVDYNF